MIRALVLCMALAAAACTSAGDPPVAQRERVSFSFEEGVVVCPSDYGNAGQKYSYVTDDQLTWSERMFNNKYEEKVLAEKKVIQEHCGGRSVSRVCPEDRVRAGKTYTYDPDEISYGAFGKSLAQLVEERCGVTKAEAEQARLQEQADREAGFHCLSAWDGNFNNLERLIRSQLLDPSSMETVSTRIAPAMPNGKHRVEMVFRATNQYGAVVTATALGSAHNNSCIAELFSINGQIITGEGCSHEIFGIIRCE